MGDTSRAALRVWLIAFVGVLCVMALEGAGRVVLTAQNEVATPVLRSVNDDAGDHLATTTYDGPMVRRRTAIGVRPVAGADRDLIGRQLRAAAAQEKLGPLSEATFAVFSAELLRYLVPEIVVVLPEGATLEDAEILMKDHSYPTVAFYLAESVVVHDLTFAVISNGVPAGEVRDGVDREGVLSDSLGHYTVDAQNAGLTVKYFGALLSDGQILAVRESMARSAKVAVDRVLVEPTRSGGGVDLRKELGPADLVHLHE
jgi:hypothetical protein